MSVLYTGSIGSGSQSSTVLKFTTYNQIGAVLWPCFFEVAVYIEFYIIVFAVDGCNEQSNGSDEDGSDDERVWEAER